jgi:hypothetical protein
MRLAHGTRLSPKDILRGHEFAPTAVGRQVTEQFAISWGSRFHHNEFPFNNRTTNVVGNSTDTFNPTLKHFLRILR